MATKLEAMQAELERLKAENEALKAAKQGTLSVKQGNPYECLDGEKLPTAVFSVYGLGRFPTSLYDTQWERLAAYIPTVLDTISKAREAGKLPTPAQVVKQKADRKQRKQAEQE